MDIFRINLNKFSYLYEPYLFVLFKINKRSKILFYYTIFFYLALNLRVEGSRKSLLDTKEVTQRKSEFRAKNQALITYNQV